IPSQTYSSSRGSRDRNKRFPLDQ
ncbi:unnamed protein product, partial [Rotaria sordida]